MRVQLGTGTVADDVEPVCDAQSAIARIRRPTAGVEPVVLQPEVVDRELAADREQDRVTLGGRAVVEVDDVCAVLAGSRPRADRPHPGPDLDAVAFEGGSDRLGVAGVVGRRQPRSGLDDRRRHPEPDIHLGELAAGRPTAQHEQARRQLAGEGGLAVGPGRHRVEPGDGRDLRLRTDGDDHIPSAELVLRPVVADDHAAAADDGRVAPVHGRPGCLEAPDMTGVIGLGRVGGPVDHPVAVCGGTRPVVTLAGLAACSAALCRSDFDGRQPMCGQLPPNQRRSTTATAAPSSRPLYAAASPAGPAPMMRRS